MDHLSTQSPRRNQTQHNTTDADGEEIAAAGWSIGDGYRLKVGADGGWLEAGGDGVWADSGHDRALRMAVRGTLLAVPVDVPWDVSVSGVGAGAVSVSWSAPSRAPAGYEVRWAREDLGFLPDGAAGEAERGSVLAAAGESSLRLGGLTAGAVYKAAVKARYSSSDGGTGGVWSAAAVGAAGGPAAAVGEGFGLAGVMGAGSVDLWGRDVVGFSRHGGLGSFEVTEVSDAADADAIGTRGFVTGLMRVGGGRFDIRGGVGEYDDPVVLMSRRPLAAPFTLRAGGRTYSSAAASAADVQGTQDRFWVWEDPCAGWAEGDQVAVSFDHGAASDAVLGSADASLGALSLHGATLAEQHTAGTLAYTAEPDPDASQVTVTAESADPNACSVAVSPADADTAGHQIDIADNGTSAISVTVTAADNATATTYTVDIAPGPPRLDALAVSPGTLSPAFSPDTTAYQTQAAHHVRYVTVAAQPDTRTTTLAWSTPDALPDTAGHQIALAASAQPRTAATTQITATARNATGAVTYTVDIERAAPPTGTHDDGWSGREPTADATLSELTLTGAQLDRDLSTRPGDHSTQVPHHTDKVKLRWTLADSNATATMTTSPPPPPARSGAGSARIGTRSTAKMTTTGLRPRNNGNDGSNDGDGNDGTGGGNGGVIEFETPLKVGDNRFEIRVTAEDRITTRSYTTTVTRASTSLTNVSEGSSPAPGPDLPADATTRGRVLPGSSVYGLISNDWDRDWYAMDLEAGTRYVITMDKHLEPNSTFGIDAVIHKIVDSDGNVQPNTYNDDWGLFGDALYARGRARVYFTPAASGTYYVELGGDSVYRRTVRIGDDGTIYIGSGEWYELYLAVAEVADETRDTATTARVGDDGIYIGVIEGDHDTDWVGMHLIAGKYYKVGLTWPRKPWPGRGTTDVYPQYMDSLVKPTPGVADYRDTRFWLMPHGGALTGVFDSSGQHMPRPSPTGGAGAGYVSRLEYVIRPETTGMHYVRVRGTQTIFADQDDARYSGLYRIVVRETADNDVPASTATTKEVQVGGHVWERFEYGGDRDWIKVRLQAGKQYAIRLGDRPFHNTNITRVLNSQGVAQPLPGDDRRLQTTWNSWSAFSTIAPLSDIGRRLLTTFSPPADGDYYIEVGSQFYASNYRVEVVAADDEPVSIETGARTNGALASDVFLKWYEVDLEQGQRYTAVAYGGRNYGGSILDPILHGAYGPAPAPGEPEPELDVGFNNTSFTFTATATGTYRFAVTSRQFLYFARRGGTYQFAVYDRSETSYQQIFWWH